MKELTIEQKAQRYDEAIETTRKWYDANTNEGYRGIFEEIFPELKESGDERIRQFLIHEITETSDEIMSYRNMNKKDVLAWLEKHGEMDMESYKTAEDEKREFVGDGFIKCYADFQDFKEGETYWLEYIGNDNYNVRSDNLLGKTYHITPCQLYTIFKKQTWLEKKGEQKSSDEVEPKFKVGDWIVYRNGIWKIGNIALENYYELLKTNNEVATRSIKEVDENAHLWTIQDAKDGDVLAAEDKDKIFIYNGKLDLRGRVCAYCGIYKTHDGLCFTECAVGNYFTYKEPYPAAKEQRDLLFQKMKEARYEWDAEKKELKKIEERIADNIPQAFEKYVEHLLSLSDGEGHGSPAKVKDVSAELFKLAKLEQKHLWSEEDENRINRLIAYFEDKESFTAEDDIVYANWLKSLKDRYTWKPSDEQMDMLKIAVSTSNSIVLDSLYNDLMKLKE